MKINSYYWAHNIINIERSDRGLYYYSSAFTTITIRFSGTNFVSPLFPCHEQRPPIIMVFSPQCHLYTLQPSNRYNIIVPISEARLTYYTLLELGYIHTGVGVHDIEYIPCECKACALEHFCRFTIQLFDDGDDYDTKRLHKTTLKLRGRSFLSKGMYILYGSYCGRGAAPEYSTTVRLVVSD